MITNQIYGQSNVDSLTEISIIDTIWELEEIQQLNKSIVKEFQEKRSISVFLYKKPEESVNGFYWVKVVEDNGSSFVSHYNFFIYPSEYKILYFDPLNNREVDLIEWRKHRNKE